MLFVSGTHILSNRSSRSKVLYKKGTLKIFAKPTGKHLCQRFPFNKEKTPAHVFRPLQSISGGCFGSNIYIKNDRTATWIGKKNNNMPNYVDLCCFHVPPVLFSLYLHQRLLSGPFCDLFQWFLARFCIHI